MNRTRDWSVLVLLMVGASGCIEDSSREMIAGSSQTATSSLVIIRETFGINGGYAIGAPTIAFGDFVEEEVGGRLFQMFLVSELGNEFQIVFNDPDPRCVGLKNGTDFVAVRACGGDRTTNTEWIVTPGPNSGSCLIKNQNGKYLSGPNGATPGQRFTVQQRGANGWLQQFMFPSGRCP